MSTALNKYWRTCRMRCNHTRISLTVTHCISLSLWLEQTLPSSQSTASVLQEAAVRCHLCGGPQCAKTTATLIHLHSLHSPAQKDGVMGKRSPPHSACTRTNAIVTPSTSHRSKVPCAQHTHGGNERDASNSTALRFTSLRHDGLSSHTHSEARRTPSAPLRVHSAGRRPVTLVPSQWGAKTIVVADHRCL
ncbi:hypothetical protein TcCL_ESM06034 [Trypanosoma cruzi]|nr:hypothetical protein TcCL_ESM06034 [Trypanosoma cruzi]